MNVYFLVEGEKTEMMLYPAWIEHLKPELQRARELSEVASNHYYIHSAGGYPHILGQMLKNSIMEMIEHGNFQHLVVALDSDELSSSEMRDIAVRALGDLPEQPSNFDVHFVVQHRCIETWLLGNDHFMAAAPNDLELIKFRSHYNVRLDDPEYMPEHVDFASHAEFHLKYVKAVFRERNVCYAKNSPGEASEPYYLDAIVQRATSAGQMPSFLHFLNVIQTV